jgi:hypothetical protein
MSISNFRKTRLEFQGRVQLDTLEFCVNLATGEDRPRKGRRESVLGETCMKPSFWRAEGRGMVEDNGEREDHDMGKGDWTDGMCAGTCGRYHARVCG